MSIIVKNLTHIYNEGMPFASKALDDVSFEIKDRDFVGLIGHTGSGKSTLIDKDIAFGPSNLGLEESEIHNRVKASMEAVGLDYEGFKDKSPFELSGGQKRRVAIAGVIAMNPEVLILDEPTAGLDPGGRDEIFNLIKDLHEKKNMTIILSSHSMDDMAKLAKTLIVMNHGSVEFMGTPREVFKSNASKLKDIGLDIPQVLELALKLREKGFDISEDILTLEEAKQEILKVVRGRGLC